MKWWLIVIILLIPMARADIVSIGTGSSEISISSDEITEGFFFGDLPIETEGEGGGAGDRIRFKMNKVSGTYIRDDVLALA